MTNYLLLDRETRRSIAAHIQGNELEKPHQVDEQIWRALRCAELAKVPSHEMSEIVDVYPSLLFIILDHKEEVKLVTL